MSVEVWIIDELEKEEQRRREEQGGVGLHLPRRPGEVDGERSDEPRHGKQGGRVEILDISPRPDNVVDL